MGKVLPFRPRLTPEAALDAFTAARDAFEAERTAANAQRVLAAYEAFYDAFVGDRTDRDAAVALIRRRLGEAMAARPAGAVR
jgi:hypothetical protein